MLYIEEVHEGDAPPPSEHAGQPVEHLGPLFADGPASAGTMDVATLTAQDIAEHKARLKADAAIAASAGEARAASNAAKARGNADYAACRYADAIRAYDDAIALDGSSHLAHGNRSAARLASGDAAGARLDAERMVALAPRLAKAHVRLGAACERLHDHRAAAIAYAEALRLEPKSNLAREATERAVSAAHLEADAAPEAMALLQRCREALAAATVAAPPAPPPPLACRDPVSWVKVEARGGGKAAQSPPARGGATLTALGGSLWLIGGADRTGSVQAAVWCFTPGPAGLQHSAGAWARREYQMRFRRDYVECENEIRASRRPQKRRFRSPRTGQAAYTPALLLRMVPSGDAFTPRHGHAATAAAHPADGDNGSEADAGSVLVYGGKDAQDELLQGVFRLSPAACGEAGGARWTLLRESGEGKVPPVGRAEHSLSWGNGAGWLFGGADESGLRGDLLRLSLTSRWAATCGPSLDSHSLPCLIRAPMPQSSSPVRLPPHTPSAPPHRSGAGEFDCRWEIPRCTGAAPSPRGMHAATVLPGGGGGDALVIHGGRGGDGSKPLGDLFILGLSRLCWSSVSQAGGARFGHAAAPLPVAAARATAAASETVLFFGGITTNGASASWLSDSWQLQRRGGGEAQAGGAAEGGGEGAATCGFARLRSIDPPSRRFAHAMAALGGSAYVFGGSDASCEMGDLYAAEMEE